MSENAKIEPESGETGYATVSSTNNYTVEHDIVELKSSVGLVRLGADSITEGNA